MKKKLNRLEKVFDAYVERLQDLQDNPMYEDFSNRKLNPLLWENRKMMLDALLEDEDETIDLLKSDEALERLIDFLLPIQKEFKSEKIAKQLNETLVDIKNNKYATVYDHYYRYLKRKINKANKVLEEN